MRLSFVDASIALKWFFQEEKNSLAALEILNQIKNQPTYFAVPELFFNEMLHVFCKTVQDKKLILEYLGALQDLGFARFGNGGETLKTAVYLAKTYQLSGYDAIYAANAMLSDGVWITADEKAHRKIEKLKISQLL